MPRAKPTPFVHYPAWSHAKFWAFIRSGLRAKWSRYPVKFEVLNAAKRKYEGPNKQQKWEFLCAKCNQWHLGKQVQVDHIIPAGTLKSFEDLPGFVQRLFCGASDLRVLCLECHKIITKEQKETNKND